MFLNPAKGAKHENPFKDMNKKREESLNKKAVTESEAFQILNFEKEEELSEDLVRERFVSYFERNDPEKGGSVYIRAKIVNAKDTIVKTRGWNLKAFDKQAEREMSADVVGADRKSTQEEKSAKKEDPEEKEKDSKTEEETSKTDSEEKKA